MVKKHQHETLEDALIHQAYLKEKLRKMYAKSPHLVAVFPITSQFVKKKNIGNKFREFSRSSK